MPVLYRRHLGLTFGSTFIVRSNGHVRMSIGILGLIGHIVGSSDCCARCACHGGVLLTDAEWVWKCRSSERVQEGFKALATPDLYIGSKHNV